MPHIVSTVLFSIWSLGVVLVILAALYAIYRRDVADDWKSKTASGLMWFWIPVVVIVNIILVLRGAGVYFRIQ